jgi:hypothetical protein
MYLSIVLGSRRNILQVSILEAVVREIRRKTRKKYSTEEKIRIVLEGLKGEDSIAVGRNSNL